MSAYVDNALTLLKTKGFRMTQPRKLVLNLLENTHDPLSPYDMKAILDGQGEKVDTVTIYRILDCLESNHLVHRVLTTGKFLKCQIEHEATCTRKQADHCHHLLICKQCGHIEEVHCTGIDAMVSQIEAQTHFKIASHSTEFFGTCKACQS